MTAYDPQREPKRDYTGVNIAARMFLVGVAMFLVLGFTWLVSGKPTACEQLGACVYRAEVYR